MPESDELNPGCDLHQVLYRDDGEVLGCVLCLEGDPSIYAHTLTCDALRRLGAHPTAAAARRAVERAVGTERERAVVTENWLEFILRRGEELARRLVVTPTPPRTAAGRRDLDANLYAPQFALERVTRPAGRSPAINGDN